MLVGVEVVGFGLWGGGGWVSVYRFVFEILVDLKFWLILLTDSTVSYLFHALSSSVACTDLSKVNRGKLRFIMLFLGLN